MPQKIHKLLVPVAGTPESEAALPLAAKLAQGLDAEIVLMHVTELPETQAQEADARESAHDALTRAGEKLPGSVRFRVEEAGDPVKGILHAIAEEQPDLVIMATHGRTGISALAEGSVAYDVVTAGVAPVALVHTPGTAT